MPQSAPLLEPLIPASTTLPEITIKGTILAILLTIILAGANAFLGLKVGLTVSASIPAAVISMGVLRFFKNSNVLENNIVQTCASSGEALTAGVSFTIPALIVIHFWDHFSYLATAVIAMAGGIIGVLFSVPLRRVLLSDSTLRFPEGTAIGKVLMASADRNMGLDNLMWGGGIGALISLCQTGFKLLADDLETWFRIGNTVVGAGIGFSPALIGAGYIIGVNVAMSMLSGIVLGWLIGVPILAHIYPAAPGTAVNDIAMGLWSQHIRYIGIGVMVVGGFWAIGSMFKPMIRGIIASFASVRLVKLHGDGYILRTDHDLPITTVFWALLVLLCPIYFLLNHFTDSATLGIGGITQQTLTWVGVVLTVFLGFAVAAICGYFAGLVGSSANPLSSMALISLIITSFIVVGILGPHIALDASGAQAISAAGVVVIITAIVSSVASISNDTIQDLKAGQMVGATPWRQQAMLILGVVVASLVIPLILELLFQAYGLGGVMPHPNMDPNQMLLAPQAGLMATVVQGIFTHHVEWNMLGTGALIAIIALIADHFAKKRGFRVPVLGVGIGIYLPVSTTTPMVIGGILSYLIEHAGKKRHGQEQHHHHRIEQRGLLLASGLVAGAAIMGVILAIPFALKGSSDVMSLVGPNYATTAGITSIIVTLLLCAWIRKRVLTYHG